MFTELTKEAGLAALEPMCGCGLLGALKCIAGVEGILPMIHGPVSCSSGHRLAMLYAGVEPLLPTTCVEQSQMVLGSCERLEQAMRAAWEKYHPEILLVLLSCAVAMMGEDYQSCVRAYCQDTGKLALVLDGSALAGDEVDICPKLYAALCEALGVQNGTGSNIALEGFAKTDYAFQKNLPALERLINDSLQGCMTPGLFADSDVFSADGAYAGARKVYASLLWKRDGLDSAAPIGVRGSWRYLNYISRETGLPLRSEAERIYREYEEALEPIAAELRGRGLSVAVEGAGWYAYALADYLKNDLGCRVLLSVDRESGRIPWRKICDAFYEDTGRFELVELIQEFGAKIVFGSSNVQMDAQWRYIPFYQPVWRVVEPMALLGYEAAIQLAKQLLPEAIG
ncbi:MAG: nitrogenase component 1 [Clostridia bacterium]|nr:nitrogenase component 1 [Clostridia bacterium]